MKIGILTQPLHTNYGGILQAYALQKALKDLGHEPWLVRRVLGKRPFIRRIVSFLNYLFLKYFLNKKNLISPLKKQLKLTEREKEIISENTTKFVEKHINPKTGFIDNDKELKKLSKQGFEAFVVGSDQVWRLNYSPNMPNFYLDFLGKNKKAKRLTYAASFGLDHWDYPWWLTKKTRKLAKRFNGISVREEAGVELCKTFLGVSAKHLVDPTLLLTPEDYSNLIEAEKESKSPGDLLVYMLDQSQEKEALIKTISEKLGLNSFSVMPKKKITIEDRTEIQDGVFPPVTKWLKGFEAAKFVVTDSFHGCIFSILYNVPFLAFGNKKRGLSRFESLLNMFNLSERLVISLENVNYEALIKPIDWSKVNTKVEQEREKSFSFLNHHLSS